MQKQTFQNIFEKLVSSNGDGGKFPPKQLENFRHLLENVRDSKNLQLIVEKFKNLEQFEQSFLTGGNNNSVIAEGIEYNCFSIRKNIKINLISTASLLNPLCHGLV